MLSGALRGGRTAERGQSCDPLQRRHVFGDGVEPLYSQIRSIPVDRGRFLVDRDNDAAARVAVLGDNVRKQLFGERPSRQAPMWPSTGWRSGLWA